MQIKYLEYLIKLEQLGSINKAAASLYISQQGLSRILDAIEAELGTRIVDRSHSGVQFTEAGEAFLGHAHTIVEEYQAACNKLVPAAPDSEQKGIDVVISPYMVITLFNAIMSKIDVGLEVTYHEQTNERIIRALQQEGTKGLYLFDWVGDSLEDTIQHGLDDIVIDKAFSSKLGILVGKNERVSFITKEEILQRPIASYGSEDYIRTLQHVFDLEDIPESNIIVSLSSEKALIDAVLHNDSACVLVDRFSFVHSAVGKGLFSFVPLEPTLCLNIGFVYRKGDPNVKQFNRYIRAWNSVFEKNS